MGALSRLIQPFIDFVYPSSCVSCESLLQSGEEHICQSCWSSLPRLSHGHELFRTTRARLLEHGSITDLISVFVFEKDGSFQNLVHLLKYEGFQSVGLRLGRELGSLVAESGLSPNALVPVPLHKVKFRERGFNQSDLIARGASEILGVPVKHDWVVRTRNTGTQTQLSLEERERNVRDAFMLSERGHSQAKGSVVLVIDDVITTGSTIVSCAGALLSGGASQVIAASAALAE